MSCREVEDLLIELHDGRLDSSRELRLHAHVETCASCREHAQTWRTLLPAMRPLAPPPPSPFDERRMMAEIERRLATTSARSPRRMWRAWLAPSIAALAAACVLLTWRIHQSRLQSRVAAALAYGSVVTPSEAVRVDGRPLAKERLLQRGAQVSVAAGGAAKLMIRGAASLTLEGPGRLTLDGDPAHVVIRLDDGILEAAVIHRAPDETFSVVTPDGRVEVRGTRFVVAAAGSGSWVRVDEGRVATFDRGGEEQLVSAGERRDLSPQAAPLAAPSVTPPALPAPSAASPARPRDACREPAIDCGRLTQQARALMRDRRYGDALAALAPALVAHGACAHRALSCRDELGYLRAEALRLMGQLDEAVAAYRSLDRGGAPAAMRQNALYAAAQLERRLGRLGAARVDYEAALATFPAGPLREEAMLGAVETAERAGDGDAALVAARRYLAAFPSGIGATEARRIEANERTRRGSAP